MTNINNTAEGFMTATRWHNNAENNGTMPLMLILSKTHLGKLGPGHLIVAAGGMLTYRDKGKLS